MKFIGILNFIGSTRPNRQTNVMTFETMTDWVETCRQTYKDLAMIGDYDGTEIEVVVYHAPASHLVSAFDPDDAVAIEVYSIVNPYV